MAIKLNNNPLKIELPANLLGKDYVVGDLHGCYRELKTLLKFVDFDIEKDRLFCVGDLIHRGQYSEKCMKLLKERNSRGEKWFYSVVGNHDDLSKQHNFTEYNVDVTPYEDVLSEIPYIYVVNHPIFDKYYILHGELNYHILFPHDHLLIQNHENILSEEERELKEREQKTKMLQNDYSSEIIDLLNDHNFTLSEHQRLEMIWSRNLYHHYNRAVSNKVIDGDFRFLNRKTIGITNKIKIFCGHNVVPFPQVIGHQIYCDTGACFGYVENSNKSLKYYAKWGMSFFYLTLIDVNLGKAYGCVSSKASYFKDKDNNKICKQYQRGDVFFLDKPLYKSIYEV